MCEREKTRTRLKLFSRLTFQQGCKLISGSISSRGNEGMGPTLIQCNQRSQASYAKKRAQR